MATTIIDPTTGQIVSRNNPRTPPNVVTLPVASATGVGLAHQIVHNVLAFGAIGDGVNDDSPYIQAAINAAQNAGGGTVFLPAPYTYLCASSLSITSPINMVGGGGWGIGDANAAKIKAVANLNAHLVQFTTPATKGMVGACFRNLVFDGQGANQTAGDIFNATGAIHCLWDFVHFIKPWGNGLALFQDGNGGTGHHNKIVNCLFDNGTQSNGGDGRGLLIQASDENYVGFCDFEGNGRVGAAQPNHIYDRSGLNQFVGCVFVNGATGVKCEANASRIVGCVFDGCKDHNIRLNGSRHIVSACNFLTIGIGSTANTIEGVRIDNVADCAVTGCTFAPDAGGGCSSGVSLNTGPATNTMVTDNTFTTVTGAFGTAAVNLGAGLGHRITNNRGWNPRGSQTPPTITASPMLLANPFPYDCTVYVAGGTVSAISITGASGGAVATGVTSGPIRVPCGGSITLTYSVAPTWTWFAD